MLVHCRLAIYRRWRDPPSPPCAKVLQTGWQDTRRTRRDTRTDS